MSSEGSIGDSFTHSPNLFQGISKFANVTAHVKKIAYVTSCQIFADVSIRRCDRVYFRRCDPLPPPRREVVQPKSRN